LTSGRFGIVIDAISVAKAAAAVKAGFRKPTAWKGCRWMKPNQNLKKLSRFIATMLGRSPDEFGLIPDRQGFVSVKELLKAITEEKGWRHVRRSHLNEMLLSLTAPDFEIVDRQIRATDRSKLPRITRPVDLPKLLYTCVRRKAHPFVIEKGISAGPGNRIVLSTDASLAERIGRRKDQHPVTITVRVEDCVARGVGFDRCGKRLYLADFIPAGCLSAPPLPKEKRPADKEKEKPRSTVPTEAGTFKMDPARFKVPGQSTQKEKGAARKKDPAWKRERRRQKKHSPKR
jgi:putative RNA 2'-phosphotransferase